MDIIYKHALLTIVALSGETSDSGLAGIRPDSRLREEVPFAIKGTPVIASLDPVGTSKTSQTRTISPTISGTTETGPPRRRSFPAVRWSSRPTRSTGNVRGVLGAKRGFGKFRGLGVSMVGRSIMPAPFCPGQIITRAILWRCIGFWSRNIQGASFLFRPMLLMLSAGSFIPWRWHGVISSFEAYRILISAAIFSGPLKGRTIRAQFLSGG
jgi:hypothetical protein